MPAVIAMVIGRNGGILVVGNDGSGKRGTHTDRIPLGVALDIVPISDVLVLPVVLLAVNKDT